MNYLFYFVAALAVIMEFLIAFRANSAEKGEKKTLGALSILKNSPQIIALLVAVIFSAFSFNLAQALLGVVLLIRAADILIDGAKVVAARANIPPIVIGVVIIGLGTSAPEFFVNVISALQGKTDIALGNVIGSNISNMGLVVGIAGIMVGKIKIQKSVISSEMPAVLAASLLLLVLSLDFPPLVASGTVREISRQDGLILLLGLSVYLIYTFHVISDVPPNPDLEKTCVIKFANPPKNEFPIAIGKIILGVAGLYLGGDFTVNGATAIAIGLGAGTLVVGVIIGVGTSLPELATAVTSALRKETDLVIGNVVGSNIFNILLILGATALIKPIAVNSQIFIHLIFLIIVTAVFFIAMWTKRELSKTEAIILTLMGIGYVSYSIITGGS